MLVERTLPKDFNYKGNRRKRSLRLSALPPQSGPKGVHSIGFKHLATSEKKRPTGKPETMADVLKASTTALDRHRRAYRLYSGLMDTMKGLLLSEESLSRMELVYEASGAMPRVNAEAARGARRRGWSAVKDYNRLSACQSQWLGFKASCCGGRAVAVPIGCNHRLCPLCNNHRAERYRSRVQAMFHELRNPQLLTLTVPSPRIMNRLVLDTLRARLKAFLKENRVLLLGGVYSMEITYNPRTKGWHPHIHVLVDVNDPRTSIPRPEFIERKQKLEFSWLVLTQGKRLKGEKHWRNSDYEEWAGAIRDRNPDLIAGGGRHRRLVDIRPVTKDKKAAYEVLKYMSKAATFIGDPVALKQLLQAIRGVRQIQTFGHMYGFKIEQQKPTEHMKCECGTNDWKPIGILGLGMVRLSPEGTWYVRDDAPVHGRRAARCRGSST